jgi:hypothetical protein
MIYNILRNKTVFEANPGLETNDVFAQCKDEELRYVFFMYDLKSPYATMVDDERMSKSLIESGYGRDSMGRWKRNANYIRNDNNKRVVNAVKEFKYIMEYSYPEYKTLRALSKQIHHITEFLQSHNPTSTKEMLEAAKLTKELPVLIAHKKEIESILGVEAESDYKQEEAEDDTKVISALDEYNQNDNE